MATFTVTNLNDAGAGSLRGVLAQAKANGGADTIVFQAGLTGTITLTGGELLIDQSVTITGPGADKLTLSGGGANRVFFIQNAGADAPEAVTISGLTLANGSAAGVGGAIAVLSENLSLDQVAIVNSEAAVLGGGVYANLSAQGGGAAATLTIANSSLWGNRSTNPGGGLTLEGAGTALVQNSTFSANASGSSGGGINSSGATALTLLNSTFVGNTATGGGGLFSVSPGTTVRNNIFAGNTANLSPDVVLSNAAEAYNLYSVAPTFLGGGPLAATSKVGAAGLAGATLVGGLRVYVPNAGSAVIDAGDPAYTGPPNLDQRGLARVVGGRIDIGAVEFAQAVVADPPSVPEPPPTVEPIVTAYSTNLLGRPGFGVNAPPATVTTPDGKVLPNPILEQQKVVAALIAKVDAGAITLRQAQDIIVDMADATTSVATMNYQFFTGRLPTKEGFDFLVSSPLNPTDLNDGFYAGMSLENRYINMAVNLGKVGEGRASFTAGYGSLSLSDATAKAYLEIFGKTADTAKLAAILTPERQSYFLSMGGDALGQKAAMVGFLLGEAAKADLGPYAARNENFLYDLLDGVAAFGADAHVYDFAGPITVGLIGAAA